MRVEKRFDIILKNGERNVLKKALKILSDFEMNATSSECDALQMAFEDSERIGGENALPMAIDFIDFLLQEEDEEEEEEEDF